ncbi:MAG: metallophosphoesterase [Deltaproteobacteria bacterium]|nr:metallophosphoesterase [Deltaproteobacteria bacterium]
MRAIFIADAHLGKPEDTNYRLLLRFLGELPGRTEMLVIAGDFFEFWLGDSPEPFPHYRPVLDALARVTRSGIKLIFLEGNHDFHLQRYFRSAFNADVFPESTVLTLDGKKLFICHGDLINMTDYGYRALRLLFRNPLTRLLARILPASVPAWIAVKLGSHSKGNHKAAAAKWNPEKLVRDFAADRFAAGNDVVVTAHYHHPFMEENAGKCLLALGDWITQFSYGEWQDGKLALKAYQPNNL